MPWTGPAGSAVTRPRSCTRRLDRASCSAFASPAPARGIRLRARGHPGWRYNGPGYPAIEIAVYPDIIRLVACNLRAGDTSHLPAP